MTSTSHGRSVPRIPLNTLAIAFGFAGQATLWTTVIRNLGGPELVPVILWIATAVVWVWLITAHISRGVRSSQTLMSQLRHPAQGPIAALVPVMGMLLGSELYLFWPLGGTVLTIASLVLAGLFAGWILAYWHRGKLSQGAFHGGYLFPTVAAALIGSIASSRLGLPGLAFGSFAVGVFFWVVLGTVLLSRLAFFEPLPDALTPTLAIVIAPPAIAGAAWFAMEGVHADAVSAALLGILVVMLLFQLFMIGTYIRLPFTLGYWSFTFPVAAAASYGIQWMHLSGFPGWPIVAMVVATLSAVLTAGIAVRSLLLITSVRRGVRRAEATLRRADDAATRSTPVVTAPTVSTHHVRAR